MMCMIIATTFTVAWVPVQLDRIVIAYGNRRHGYLIVDSLETIAGAIDCLERLDSEVID